MIQKLQEIQRRHQELGEQMSDPAVLADRNRYRDISRSYAELSEVVAAYQELQGLEQELAESREIAEDRAEDAEIRSMAVREADELEERLEELRLRIKSLLVPRDPSDGKNVILEIRAGTGGDEAALFAADLLRMYLHYSEGRRWKAELMSANQTGIGGFKEAIYMIAGKDVYSRLKFESGVHRVQRVPVTETSGRIHTSAVTVAVLPEAEDVEVEIDPQEIRIDVFRSSGPGGQSVNTTDSAVRINHFPSGITVSCQDEKSQLKNRNKAMKILRARLLALAEEEQRSQIEADRRSQVGSGDRSAKIRTYNFPQNRVTDHRIGLTLHRLEAVLQGDLEEIIDTLTAHQQAEKLQQISQADAV